MNEKQMTEKEFNQVLVGFGESGAFEGRHDEVIGLRVSYAAADHAHRDYYCIMSDGSYSSMCLRFKLIPSVGTIGIHVIAKD